jgi:hypothetical protein
MHQCFHANPFGDGVSMRPVRTRDDVIRLQSGTNTDRYGLLTLILMNGAGHDTLEEKVFDTFFKLPDE